MFLPPSTNQAPGFNRHHCRIELLARHRSLCRHSVGDRVGNTYLGPMLDDLDPASVAVGAAILPLAWIGSKLLGSLRNHAHRDRGVRGFKACDFFALACHSRLPPLSVQRQACAESSVSLFADSLQVVITGSSRGLGYALADQFLHFGDDVIISSRDMSACERAAAQLGEKHPARKALPHACDVRNAGGPPMRLDACLPPPPFLRQCCSGVRNAAHP